MVKVLGVCVVALLCRLAVAQTEPTMEEISARLTPNDLKADVSFLASDLLQGRASPSQGLDVAAEYIAAQFRRAGLEVAGDDGYFQTAWYDSVTPNFAGMELTLKTTKTRIKAQTQSITLQQAFSNDFTRVAVFKDWSTDWESLAAVHSEEVRGKVLVLDLPDANTIMTISKKRAIINRLEPVLLILPRSQSPGNTAAGLCEIPCPSSPRVIYISDDAIWAALRSEKREFSDATISVHIPPPGVVRVKLHNVLGVLRGADPVLRNTYVLVTAHYDHLGTKGNGGSDCIYNGANDNASGTASVIEIANALAALPIRPKRSIVFLTFFGEELGLLGSRYYASHPVFPIGSTVADVNLEQLGRTDSDGTANVDLVNVTGYDFSTLTDVFRKTGEDSGLRVVKAEKLNERYFGASDNQALADVGIPAHTLSVGYFFPDYHQSGDRWPKLDYNNLAKVDRTIALSVFRVANSIAMPEWNKDIPCTRMYIKARQASRGIGSQ